MKTSLPSWSGRPQFTHHKGQIQVPWRSFQVLVPHRIRRKFRSKLRSRQSPASNITALKTSFSPFDTLRALQNHQWTVYDGQYLLMAVLGIFSLCIIEHPGAIFKTAVATALLTALVVPITSQFFLPFLPIASWLIFFYACQFVPGDMRPPIWVRVLPALENIMYGANLSNLLSAHKSVVLDVLAWLPYGIIHFGAPFVVSGILFLFSPPGTLPVFARSFGYMNLMGVMIQMFFPCSPPWYENLYGLAPANYSMPGSPAGLARIDQLFGIDLYTSTFTASPMVFGAFPSLHSGCATIEALFMDHAFPKLRPLWVMYVLWLWWSTMYLSHHYAVDLVGGSILSGVVFYYAKSRFLPRLQTDKVFRWDYDYTEIGDGDEEFTYDLMGMNHLRTDSDEWTVGSSSSISSGSISPVDDRAGSWEGERITSHIDLEPAR